VMSNRIISARPVYRYPGPCYIARLRKESMDRLFMTSGGAWRGTSSARPGASSRSSMGKSRRALRRLPLSNASLSAPVPEVQPRAQAGPRGLTQKPDWPQRVNPEPSPAPTVFWWFGPWTTPGRFKQRSGPPPGAAVKLNGKTSPPR
jgi:hypothetical protein